MVMKKIVFFGILYLTAYILLPFVHSYNGARSLSLGYSTTASSYDINAMFINPALLAALNYSLTGYQYQNSYMDYSNFADELNEIMESNLDNFENLSATEKDSLFEKLDHLFSSKAGLYGSTASVPGFISRGYGISFSSGKAAVMHPVENEIFNQPVTDLTSNDIATLQMHFMGFSYKQFSFSYALNLSQGMNMGVTLHYLTGKVTEFNRSIMDTSFPTGSRPSTYLEYGWEKADSKFSRLLMDLGFSVNLGAYFNVGLSIKNITSAKIKTSDPEREIPLPKRITAGFGFTPAPDWGIYLDLDLDKRDLLFSGEKIQPVSLGVEKGFFQNKFFLRGGFLTDLTDKYFIGKKSNVLYGLGFGFNLGTFAVDFALGVDSSGRVNNLAISGFFILKKD